MNSNNENQNLGIPSERSKATRELDATQPERWGDPLPPDITFDSVESALEEVKRLILWLGYVQENEYTDAERNRLIAISRRFAGIAQKIANKYLD